MPADATQRIHDCTLTMSPSNTRRLVTRSELVIMAMFLMNPGSDSLSGSDMAAPGSAGAGGGGKRALLLLLLQSNRPS